MADTFHERPSLHHEGFVAEIEADGVIRSGYRAPELDVHLHALCAPGLVMLATAMGGDTTVYGVALTPEKLDLFIKHLQQLRAEALGAPPTPVGDARVQ